MNPDDNVTYQATYHTGNGKRIVTFWNKLALMGFVDGLRRLEKWGFEVKKEANP